MITDKIMGYKSKNTPLKTIIIINVAAFFITHIMFVSVFFNWFAMPIQPETLLSRPWTIFTHMFMHGSIMHLVCNMLWLYFCGTIVQRTVGTHVFKILYFVGGLVGAFFTLFILNLLPHPYNSGLAVGASAAIMSIMAAAMVIDPNRPMFLFFIGPFKLKHVVLVSFAITSLIDMTSNTGGKIAHIGGFLFGYIYSRYMIFGKTTPKLNHAKHGSLFSMNSFIKNKKSINRARMTDDEFRSFKVDKNKAVNAILEKISKKGINSLSRKEKNFLDNLKD